MTDRCLLRNLWSWQGFDFKVHKVKNLRIVDASVFDRTPGLFIVMPIYTISQKASQSILDDYPARF